MAEYRFISVQVSAFRSPPRMVEVLQIKKPYDRSGVLDYLPDMIMVWADADRWESEEFLRSKVND